MPKAASIPAPSTARTAVSFSFVAYWRLAASALMLAVLVAISVTVTVRTDGFVAGLVLGAIGLVWLPTLVARLSEGLDELGSSSSIDIERSQSAPKLLLDRARRLNRRLPVAALYGFGALALLCASYLASASLNN